MHRAAHGFFQQDRVLKSVLLLPMTVDILTLGFKGLQFVK